MDARLENSSSVSEDAPVGVAFMTGARQNGMEAAAEEVNKVAATDKENEVSLDSGLCSWLKPEQFLEPNFDADTYVGELQRYVPLETLKLELDEHMSFLQNHLVEVINEDYDDFVSLSTKLVNVDGAVLRMRKPLTELRERLVEVQGTVKAELDKLQDGLQRRKDVATARTILDLLQDAAHVASKVDKLLAEVLQGEGEVQGQQLDSRSRLLERVASEVSRLNFYCNKGKGLPFFDEMQPRVNAHYKQMSMHLQTALVAALKEANQSAVFHCLHGYSALGDSAGAEETIRLHSVAPLVQSVVASHTSAGPRAGSLEEVLGAMSDEIRSQCGFWLAMALDPQSGLSAFDFLSNSVLKEVHGALARDLSRTFSPGVPATFLNNYRAAVRFLEFLEGFCRSATAVDAFRGSEEHAAFMRRWNLSVYFSLRFQDIAGGMDNILASSELQLAAGDSAKGFAAAASDYLWSAMHRCLSDEVRAFALRAGM
uniref:Conserved oligomeric Golgi complex subunit 2 n=1 Tax=Tetraselmis sp. GSL018 TaxID=582737 RepID=A0A061S4J7_9CHLO